MNSCPTASPSGYHTRTDGVVPGGTSLKRSCRSARCLDGRPTVRVYAVRYTRLPSRLVTRTSVFEDGLTTSNMYVPPGSETPGSANGALKAKYVVCGAFPLAVDSAAGRPA